MDTPYKLKTILEDLVRLLDLNIPCVFAFELTKEKEKFYRDSALQVFNLAKKENLKDEFVLIVKNKISGMTQS